MARTGLKPQEIREKAIDIAKVLMRAHGFEKLRFTDVAKELGISHAALYAHFEDKLALLDAVSESWLNELDGSLEDVFQSDESAEARIKKWFVLLHRGKKNKIEHDPELFKAFDMSVESKKPFAIVHMDNLKRHLMGLIDDAIKEKTFRKDSPEGIYSVLRESMIAFYHPRIIVMHLHEKREPVLKRTLEVVLAGLK